MYILQVGGHIHICICVQPPHQLLLKNRAPPEMEFEPCMKYTHTLSTRAICSVVHTVEQQLHLFISTAVHLLIVLVQPTPEPGS